MQIKNQYPIPTYRYRVTVGYDEMVFNSVSGLDLSAESIEYKDGTGGVFRMPGQSTGLNISLKKGIALNQGLLYDWLHSIRDNVVDKKDISVSLTNETGSKLLVIWNLNNAFPTKLMAPDFDAATNEVSIEELCLYADNLTITFH